ncbi:MAG: putative DNA-binding domain-containing protein [Kordiimonadaceae bacterium]|nr:putative DNA-binding domain-containing protein [Kordiimonadaceae bacterium]
MDKIAKIQEDFRLSIHKGALEDTLVGEIISDGISASARMQVYQNNYRTTLVNLIQEVFPITAAFVGDVFLRTAAAHFIEETPPVEAGLDTYAQTFPKFLRAYSYADDVPYLADVAALEWAIYELQHVRTLADKAALQEPLETDDIFKNPDVRFVQSAYPLLQLWMVGTGQLMPEAVHIEAGAQNVGVYGDGFEIKMNTVSEEELLFFNNLPAKGIAPLPELTDIISSLLEKKLLLNVEM